MSRYQPTIGLEIHAELATHTKMFCDCLNDPLEKKPNVNICPICVGHPGTLPVINQQAVEAVLKIGLALGAEIPEVSKFDRKNYFYPDLPKGYQISQYDEPLSVGGSLDISHFSRIQPELKRIETELNSGKIRGNLENIREKYVRIRRVHLEEDTGKLIHPDGANYSLIDFNRAGVPLAELVTEPDLQSAEEAAAFAEELQLLLRYLGVSNADMEKGQMRLEANISVSFSNSPRIISNESRIVFKDESYKLVGFLFEIHRKLGPIYKEINYQNAIEEILRREHILYEREKPFTLKFENLDVSNFFADFVIENKILLEIKAKRFIAQDDIRQASRYIKSLNLPLAIIANFRKKSLETQRVINPAFEHNKFENNSRDNIRVEFEKKGDNIRTEFEKKLGTKVEVKNLNSFRALEEAIRYEIKRQTELLEEGKKVTQETRGWDDFKKETFSQRLKEGAEDYRYFPEPDLPSIRIANGRASPAFAGGPLLELTKFDLEKIRREIPELPAEKRARLEKEYGLTALDARALAAEPELAEFFERASSELATLDDSGDDPKDLAKFAFNYLFSDLRGLMSAGKLRIADIRISPKDFARLMLMARRDEISSRGAKDALSLMFRTGESPENIIRAEGLAQISDEARLKAIIFSVIEENPKAVEDYRKGKIASLQFLVGKAMAKSKGAANPKVVEEILKQELSS